jgi:hypothetical protein
MRHSTLPESTNGNRQTAGGTRNGNGAGNSEPAGSTFETLVQEAQSLQESVRQALIRSNRLLAGLKQRKRQSKAFETTLANLRQLEGIEA